MNWNNFILLGRYRLRWLTAIRFLNLLPFAPTLQIMPIGLIWLRNPAPGAGRNTTNGFHLISANWRHGSGVLPWTHLFCRKKNASRNASPRIRKCSKREPWCWTGFYPKMSIWWRTVSPWLTSSSVIHWIGHVGRVWPNPSQPLIPTSKGCFPEKIVFCRNDLNPYNDFWIIRKILSKVQNIPFNVFY